MSTTNYFAGIEDEQDPGYEVSEFLSVGDYLIEITRFVTFESRNPKNAGVPMAVIEGRVLEVLSTNDGATPAGSLMKQIEKLPQGQGGAMARGYALRRVKNFVGAALGDVPDDAITADVVFELTLSSAEMAKRHPEMGDVGVYGEGEALAGTVLLARVRQAKNRRTGEVYDNLTNTYWSRAEATTAEEIPS